MKLLLCTVVALSLSCGIVDGQVPEVNEEEIEEELDDDAYWSSSFRVGFNFNQATFSGNWMGGGVNSLALGSLGLARLHYERDRVTFDNELELLYGIVRQEGQDFRKANDQIFLDSKIGYELTPDWNSYFSLNFESQFAPGYEFENDEREQISGFLSPAYVTSSLGFEYRPSEEFVLRVGPLSPRVTIMRDQTIHENVPENYGVPVGETYRFEPLALQVYSRLDTDIAEDLNLRARYRMFANYQELSLADIEHRLDVTLTATIIRFVDVTLSGTTVYDNDEHPDIQYSTGLTVGVVFRVIP